MWVGWQIHPGQHENGQLAGHAVYLDPLPGHGILHEQPAHRLVPTAHLGAPTDLDPPGEAGHGVVSVNLYCKFWLQPGLSKGSVDYS